MRTMGGSSMELSCSSSRLRSACSFGQVRRLCPEPPQYPQRWISAALSGTWSIHVDKGRCRQAHEDATWLDNLRLLL